MRPSSTWTKPASRYAHINVPLNLWKQNIRSIPSVIFVLTNFSMEFNASSISRFVSQHKMIKQYIDGLPPGGIYHRLSPDRLSIHETITYLTRYHHIFLARVKSICSDVNPFFEMYRPDDDPEYHFAVARTTGSLLHELYRVRDEIQLTLEDLSEGECSRVGTHSVLGKMDIRQWLEFFLLHESNHLFRIFKQSSQFWSTEHELVDGVIHLPRLSYQVDELAG
jgi:hypothetical protein